MNEKYVIKFNVFNTSPPLADNEIISFISSFLTAVRNGLPPHEMTISQELVLALMISAIEEVEEEVRDNIDFFITTEEGHSLRIDRKDITLPGLLRKAIGITNLNNEDDNSSHYY